MSTPPGFQITVDCTDPHAVARFWADALGYEVEVTDAFIHEMLAQGHASESDTIEIDGVLFWREAAAISAPPGEVHSGRGDRLLFQQVAEPKVAKNRVHLDLNVGQDNVDDEVARLEALGATRLHEGRRRQGPFEWVTMADPEGNEFCVA